MMKIEILGTGCPKCQKTGELIEKGLKKSGMEAEIVKVKKIDDIVDRGVMMTPAVIINGEIKCEGKVPNSTEIEAWLS